MQKRFKAAHARKARQTQQGQKCGKWLITNVKLYGKITNTPPAKKLRANFKQKNENFARQSYYNYCIKKLPYEETAHVYNSKILGLSLFLPKVKILSFSPDSWISLVQSEWASNLDFNVSFRHPYFQLQFQKNELLQQYHSNWPLLKYCKRNTEFGDAALLSCVKMQGTLEKLQNEQRVHVFTSLGDSLVLV